MSQGCDMKKNKMTYDRKSAAASVGICVRSLDAARERGQLGFIKIGTGKKSRVLFRQADLDLFLARNHVAPRTNSLTGI